MKRLEAGSRYNKELLGRCTARPWERLVRSDARSVPLEMPAIIAPPPFVPAWDIRKRLFIRMVDLLTHGYIEGCPGCNAGRVDGPSRNHTETCRERLTTLIALSSEEERQRVEEAELRTAREPPVPPPPPPMVPSVPPAAVPNVTDDTMQHAHWERIHWMQFSNQSISGQWQEHSDFLQV